MSHTVDCLGSYFRDVSKIRFNLRLVPIDGGHLGESMSLQRPSIPLYPVGLQILAPNQFYPLAIADAITAPNFARHLADMALTASQNYYAAGGVPAGSPRYISGDYGTYLYKKYNAAGANYDRYIQTVAKADGFYQAVPALATSYEYYTALQNLFTWTQQQGDPNAFIAPGVYSWAFISDVGNDVLAWRTADPNTWGWAMLELDPTP